MKLRNYFSYLLCNYKSIWIQQAFWHGYYMIYCFHAGFWYLDSGFVATDCAIQIKMGHFLAKKPYLQRRRTILRRGLQTFSSCKVFFISLSLILHCTTQAWSLAFLPLSFVCVLFTEKLKKKFTEKEGSLNWPRNQVVAKNLFPFFSFFFFLNAFILLAAIPAIFFSVNVLNKKLEQFPFSSLPCSDNTCLLPLFCFFCFLSLKGVSLTVT